MIRFGGGEIKKFLGQIIFPCNLAVDIFIKTDIVDSNSPPLLRK